MPEHDGALDPDGVAQLLDVVRPALDAPFCRRAPVTAAGAAQVGVDDLRPGREPRADLNLEEAVVEPWAGMQQDDGLPLAHPGPLGHELRALDIEEKAHVADLDPHGATLLSARYPVDGTGATNMIERAQVIGAGRVGSAIAARLRERGLDLVRGRSGARPALRSRPRDRRGGGGARARPLGRARQRRDAARGARPARAALRRSTRCRRSRATAARSSSTARSRR